MPEQPVRILHVDDSEANRYAVTRSLRKAGFAVEEAGTGHEALAKLAEKPDLVILDVRLPDISGFEVCQRIKTNPRTASTPVLHLSASFISGHDKALGLDGGADAYLIRPVEPVELLATVNALLRTRRTEEALRLSEERYRTLVRATAAIVWDMPASGEFEGPQEEWSRFTGQTFEQLKGRGWLDAVYPDDRAVAAGAWARSVEDCVPYELEYRLRRSDGEYRHVLARAFPIFTPEGHTREWIGLHTDVTQRNRAEQERRRLLEQEQAARAEAETANRLKDDFLATLSHELRTPLNAIVGWAAILRGAKADNEDLDEGLETIERNARIQTQLIEDLLDVSRIISGKLKLDVQRVDLASVVEAAVAAVFPAAEARGVRVLRVLDPSGTTILGDPDRVQQVVWNLLSNAIKFTPRGGRVQVSLARAASQVEITVSDTGKGIAPAFLPHVFERFRQADPSTRRSNGGLGLGLAIVRHLVELHGGTARAASEGEGKGSTFTVSLPVAALQPPTAPAPAEPGVAEPGVSRARVGPPTPIDCDPVLTGLRVLVVDDEPDARGLIKRILSQCQAVVTVAGSVPEAMRELEGAGFDVLVSDIGMPGEDGYDLIRRLRGMPEGAGGRTPAIALTAFARAEDRRRALMAGFQFHVAKPVETAEFLAVVASVAGRTGPPTK